MRKLKVFLLMFAALVTTMFGLNVYADNVSVSLYEGASIRLAGEQGLKFTAKISGNYDNHEHGFYVIFGKATVNDLITAKTNNNDVINGKNYKKATLGDVNQNNEFSVVLINIPEIGYEDDITVLAYVVRGAAEVFSEAPATKSVAEVALNIYNAKPAEYTGGFKTAIDAIALPRKVKVIHSNGTISYYGDFNDTGFALEKSDEIHLSRGTFNDALLIDKDNVSVYGINKDVKVNNSGNRVGAKYDESIYKGSGGIEIALGVKNINIDGLTLASNRAVIFSGKNSNVNISNNLIKVTGNWGIRDATYDEYNATNAVSNINIVDNFFSSSAQVYFRDVCFYGFVKSLNIYGNYFNNHREEIHANDFAIRLLRYAKGAQVDIYNNTFRKYGATYVIDVGYSMGASNKKEFNNDININIEDNSFSSSYLKPLAGNAIRVMYIGDNSTITIINNTNIRTSTYYNAVMLTGGSYASYSERVENVKVEILYNKFYAATLDEVPKPADRNEVTTRYTRIGIGLPVYTDITIDGNRYGSSTSRYAYTGAASSAALKNNNQVALTTNQTSAASESTALYDALLDGFSTRVNNYLQKGPFNNVSSAHGWGLQEREITKYISNFNSKDINLIEIQNDKLTYVGRQQYLLRLAAAKGLSTGKCNGIENLEDIIVQLAYLYRAKDDKIQYDQNPGRRMLGGRPEFGTDEKNYYSDCSAFVSDVYNVAYGIPVYPGQTNTSTNTRSYMEYAKKNTSNAGVIAYVLNSNYTTAAARQKKLDDILKIMVPGDVIVYRHSNFSAGHAMLYVGNGRVIHVTGASYDFDVRQEKFEENGAALRITTAMFTDPTSSRYLFNNKDEFCVLRPLAMSTPTISNATKSRNMVEGLDIMKKASVGNYSGVSVGDDITYTISLTNTSSVALKDFTLRDTLSDNETFVSVGTGGSRSGTALTFHVDNLAKGATINFTYKIKVKKATSSDKELASNKTRVFSLYSNHLYFSILAYTPSQLTTLENRIVNSEGTSRNLRELLTYLYGANHPVVEGYMTDIYDKSDLRPRDLWGGRIFDRDATYNTHYRVRLLQKSYLTTGDIIVSYLGTSWRIYIYSPSKIVTYSSGSTTKIALSLEKVSGHEKYRVIRPTLVKV